MYEVHFRRNFDTPDDYSLIQTNNQAVFKTLEEAKKARFMAGDLVVNPLNRSIVINDSWLFDWEKSNPDSYAHKAILWQIKQNESSR